ncbi:MAG: FHA domain-containing protein [Gemmatimonadales bacterium]|nr:FHA domain-containing protein [Gemmatimonadales bacterium]
MAVRSPTLRIGRDPASGLRIDHASVSADHAELRLRGAVWTVTDLDSVNGTWVDGEAVIGALPLAPGSELRLGEVVLAFNPRDRWEDSAPDTGAQPSLIGAAGLGDPGVIEEGDATEIVATPRAHPGRVAFGGYGYEEIPAARSRAPATWIIAAVIGAALVLYYFLLRVR